MKYRDIYQYLPETLKERLLPKEEMYVLLLREIGKRQTMTMEEVRSFVKDYFWISNDEYLYSERLNIRYPELFYVVYSLVYSLHDHFLIRRVKRGCYELTEAGRLLTNNSDYIDDLILDSLPSRRILLPYEDEYHSGEEYFEEIVRAEMGAYCGNRGFREPVETWWNIEENDFQDLYEQDSRFRKIVDEGHFAYHEGEIVPYQYYFGDGDYSNLCIRYLHDTDIHVEIEKNFRTNRLSFKCITYQGTQLGREDYFLTYASICKRGIDWDARDVEKIIEEMKRKLPNLSEMEIFDYLHRVLGIKWEKLAKALGVSPRELQNWRHPEKGENAPRVPINLEKLIAICLALKLPPEITMIILQRFNAKDKNGFIYDPDAAGEPQSTWDFLIKFHYQKHPLEINMICVKNKIEPLFSQNEEDYLDEPKVKHDTGRNNKPKE